MFFSQFAKLALTLNSYAIIPAGVLCCVSLSCFFSLFHFVISSIKTSDLQNINHVWKQYFRRVFSQMKRRIEYEILLNKAFNSRLFSCILVSYQHSKSRDSSTYFWILLLITFSCNFHLKWIKLVREWTWSMNWYAISISLLFRFHA